MIESFFHLFSIVAEFKLDMADSGNHGVWKCLVDTVSWEGVLCVNAEMRSCLSPESEGSGDGVPEAAVEVGYSCSFETIYSTDLHCLVDSFNHFVVN